MKIAICLPSFNEAQNIQSITQVVDRGLSDFATRHRDVEVEIINIDSNSTDGTHEIFLSTATSCSKKSIVIEGASGKGNNLLEFCRYVVDASIDYCLTIDTDITSASPDWISKLLGPLISGDAVYVTPIYERSRFEGSSTNHFAFPFIYARTGYVVRQPIAGDFGFTHEVAAAIYQKSIESSKLIRRYGIDIFMTLVAIGTGGKVSQVDLGKKLHAPSFNKLEYMFPQIAAAALLGARIIKFQGHEAQPLEAKNNILSNLQFSHREAALEMKKKAITSLTEEACPGYIDGALAKKYILLASRDLPTETDMANLWTDILSSWMNHFLISELDLDEMVRAGEALLPFFVLRATNFWFWAETVGASDVEEAIRKQAELLRNKVGTV